MALGLGSVPSNHEFHAVPFGTYLCVLLVPIPVCTYLTKYGFKAQLTNVNAMHSFGLYVLPYRPLNARDAWIAQHGPNHRESTFHNGLKWT